MPRRGVSSPGAAVPLIIKNRTIATLRKCSQACRLAPLQASMTPAPLFFTRGQDERPLDIPAQGFDSIADALAAVAAGELVVVLDDEHRENEGDLIAAADRITPEKMAFLVRHTSGVVCIGLEGADLDRLKLPLMVPPSSNEDSMGTAFTITVDLREGTSTGISASDRVKTIRALADPLSKPEHFNRPGHIFPLRYREGGVLKRPGHTEASVDLARLAGCHPAGVLCEIVSEDGSMARTQELQAFAKQHGIKCITIADLVRYRLKHEMLIERTAEATLPTRYGTLTAYSFRSLMDGTEHVALVAGRSPRREEAVLTRIHSESALGDVFGSTRCDTGPQLDAALTLMVEEGAGVLIYLRGQQGRGLGLAEELDSYAYCDIPGSDDDERTDRNKIDVRDYGMAAHILRDLGVSAVRLLSGSTSKKNCLLSHGIRVVEQLPLDAEVAWQDVEEVEQECDSKKSHHKRNGIEPHFV